MASPSDWQELVLETENRHQQRHEFENALELVFETDERRANSARNYNMHDPFDIFFLYNNLNSPDTRRDFVHRVIAFRMPIHISLIERIFHDFPGEFSFNQFTRVTSNFPIFPNYLTVADHHEPPFVSIANSRDFDYDGNFRLRVGDAHFEIVRNDGQGDCLFRALSDAFDLDITPLDLRLNILLYTVKLEVDLINYPQFQATGADSARQYLLNFLNAYTYEYYDPEIEDYVRHTYDSLQDYREKLSNETTCVGFSEVNFAAFIFQTNLVAYYINEDNEIRIAFNYGSPYYNDTKFFIVSYDGYNNHVEYLRKVQR